MKPVNSNCPEIIWNLKIVPGAPTIILDRDGTINVDKGYVHQIADFEFTDQFTKILETLRQFKGNICVITNQGGASIGKYLEIDSRKFSEHLITAAEAQGIAINLVVTCFHHNKDHCEYRKPSPGMLKTVENLVKSDSRMFLYIGNDKKDAEVAKARNVAYLDVNSENFGSDFDDWINRP